jgi:voltage-gated potassium channel Kch
MLQPLMGDRKPTLGQRLRYAFDNTMSRGTSALVTYLAIATLALIGLFTAVMLIGGLVPTGGRHSFLGGLFTTLEHAMDPGTIANDTGRWPFLFLMLLVTVAGLFVVSALIGVIATGLDAKITELRKGRSLVLERGHTLILGWSDTVFTILSELDEAKAEESDPSIVILSERDRVEMEDRIRAKLGELKNARVVCRSGSPIDLADLDLVSPQTARSIIVLAPEAEEPDSQVIKCVLALTKAAGHREHNYHIVAEIQDPANLDAAKLVAGDEAVLIDKRETISRLIVQAARESGASVVYTELLDFAGDEIYFRDDAALAGRTFGDAVLAYEDSCVFGLLRANGDLAINPPRETSIDAGDQLIAIAADEDRLAASPPAAAAPREDAIVEAVAETRRPERTLILGWNSRAPAVVTELDKYMEPGSAITVAAMSTRADAELERHCSDLSSSELRFHGLSPTERHDLERLDPGAYDQVIVLCSDELDVQRSDARTLITLLHLRDIADTTGAKFSIVSELLDDRNRELAEVARVDDMIVSDRLISLMLAQISESKELKAVFSDLFAAEGSEVYLKPLSNYVSADGEVSFATLCEAALRRGETAIGFRAAADAGDSAKEFGVRINPTKSTLLHPAPGDRAIVLAED